MNILNPYVILGFVLALIGAFFTGHHKGYAEAQAEQQIEVARLNTLAREVEHVMTGKVNDLSIKLEKANSNAKIEIVKRNADIADGTLRLSVPTSSICPTADSSSASTDNQTRTELEPAFAQTLIAITDDGDNAIRQLNACIDAYNAIRE
jgi:prophage endopeptidase